MLGYLGIALAVKAAYLAKKNTVKKPFFGTESLVNVKVINQNINSFY